MCACVFTQELIKKPENGCIIICLILRKYAHMFNSCETNDPRRNDVILKVNACFVS